VVRTYESHEVFISHLQHGQKSKLPEPLTRLDLLLSYAGKEATIAIFHPFCRQKVSDYKWHLQDFAPKLSSETPRAERFLTRSRDLARASRSSFWSLRFYHTKATSSFGSASSLGSRSTNPSRFTPHTL